MITLKDARKALKEVVKSKGADYNYGNEFGVCEYAGPTGEPRCIVGHVLSKLDPQALEILHTYETDHSWSPGLMNGGGVSNRFEPNALHYLSAAQRVQDERDEEGLGVYTWGEALEAAEELIIK